MDLAALDLDEPLFSQKEAAQVCTVENATIDNWVRHGHLGLHRPNDRRRLFSGWDLVKIDLIAFLTTRFGLKPSDGSRLAAQIVTEYLPLAGIDVRDVHNGTGKSWRVRQQTPYYFTRDGDGVLREVRQGDAELDKVGIVVPTQLVARRTFRAIQNLERAS